MKAPIRILELRSVRGTGGGPEKTILTGAARTDPSRFAVSICYIRDARDHAFGLDRRAETLGVDYIEVRERHSLDPTIWSALRELVRARRIDIIHAHEYKTDLLALALARAAGVVPLATAHGWTGQTPRERLLYYPADKWLLARYPKVIAVSGEIRAELLRTGARPERVQTILNGIDHRVFRRDRAREPQVRAELGIASNEVVVGAVGRLEPQKRFDVLIESFSRLLSREPRLRLLVVGDGSLRGELETFARRHLPPSACRFLGHYADVIGAHHAFNVLVQSSDYEGTPNAVLEAMALETPVVATNVGGTSELVADGTHGLIVPAGDAGAIARAVERTLLEHDHTARRVAAARRRVEHELSFESRMRAVEATYEELAGELREPSARRQQRCA